MIKCKKCGHVAQKFEPVCPICKTEYTFTESEVQDALELARQSMKRRDYDYSLLIYKALADNGITEAEREYGIILERGSLVPRDLDCAMRYFGMAAKKQDPYSTYRYSRLARRTSDRASDFWLCCAAIYGSKDAFLPAAEYYSDTGDEETAHYYYTLAAYCDDTDAIVELAKRYYNGIGTEKDEQKAKWYMDKLTLPPLHALKLAYKLFKVKPRMPEEPHLSSRSRVLRQLIIDARRYELHETELYLTELYARDGSAEALCMLGSLYTEGRVCEVRTNEAIRLLGNALELGSAEAAKLLGDIYTEGRLTERNIDKALSYYQKSAGLGEGSAYEILGDMFYDGRLVSQNPAYAYDLYGLGAREGDENCKRKANRISLEREEKCRQAKEEEAHSPTTAFMLYALSCSMGYLPAHKALARMFEEGRGTKKNRKMAFTWYSLAAQKGDKDAYFDLGRCYAHGIGTRFDYAMAVENLTLAEKYGSKAAKEELTKLRENKKRGMLRSLYSLGVRLVYKRKFDEAISALTACAELGVKEALYVLGALYEFGLGVKTSRQKAFDYYNSAFDRGFRDPRQKYKLKILKIAR